MVLRYHDKNNYVVALYSPEFHAIYIHDRRNGEWGDMLGRVDVGSLGPGITLTATVSGDNAIMELQDGNRRVVTQSVRITNLSKGSAGLWMYQVGDRQEYSNYQLSDAKGKLTQPVMASSDFYAPDLPSPQDWVLVLRKSSAVGADR